MLENPWFPSNTYNFPFSLHSKGGRDVKRFVGLHHLKAHYWLVLSILDSVINYLHNRFSEDVLNFFNLRLLMPATIDFGALKKSEEANKTKLKIMKLSEIYGGILKNNAICLEAEYDVWLEKWNHGKMNNGRIPETALEVLDVCDVDMFPAIHTLIHILATFPSV